MVPLAFDQVADRQQHRAFPVAEPGAQRRAVRGGLEELQIDAVAQYRHALVGDAQLTQVLLQCTGHGHHVRGTARDLEDLASWSWQLRHQIQIGAAPGDDERPGELGGQAHRDDAVGIEVMRIDQVEVVAAVDQPADQRAHSAQHQCRRQLHADLRDHQVARVPDLDAVAPLVAIDAGKLRVFAEHRGTPRKPRHRGHDLGADLRREGQQLAQAVLDEDAVRRLARIRVQGTEGEDLHRDVDAACSAASASSMTRRALWLHK